MLAYWTFILVVYSVYTLPPANGWETPSPYQYHIQTDEGPERYFRYQTDSGQYRKEKRLEDGTVVGTYAWIDDDGILRQRDYIADNAGYRILKTKNVFVGRNANIGEAVKSTKKYPPSAGTLVKTNQRPVITVPYNAAQQVYGQRTVLSTSPAPIISTTAGPYTNLVPNQVISTTPLAYISSTEAPVVEITPNSQLTSSGVPSLDPSVPLLSNLTSFSGNSLYTTSSPLTTYPSDSSFYYSTPPSTPLPSSPVQYVSSTLPVYDTISSPYSKEVDQNSLEYNPHVREISANHRFLNGPTYPLDQNGRPYSGQKLGNGYDPQYPQYDGVSVTNDGFRYYIPRAYHEEQTLPGDKRSGSFGYIDPFGIRRVIYYNTAPGTGFQHRKNNRYVGFQATPYDPRPY